jgi:histone H3/H4
MAKKSAGKKNGSREILIVSTKMKEVVKKHGCMSSGELVEAVSAKVHELLAAAAARAKTNGRATVRPHDL